ncbi:MAG: hypothetical protein DWQ10_03570 [Calditrichaeota bacterium]|nr:MAG: hypothetical protein DWQ10_03570 [Calditrichota bacterium]
MKKFTLLLSIFSLLLAFGACNQNTSDEIPATKPADTGQILVEEVIQGTKYTYAKVTGQAGSYWLACAKTEVAVGDNVYHPSGLEMRGFHSKELDRTFDRIFFVETVSSKPLAKGKAEQGMAMQSPHAKSGGMMMKNPNEVETVSGAITLAELFNNSAKYANKQVTISGKVTKFLTGIMNKNFLHIQNDPQDGEKFDLAATTNEIMKVGDVVTLTGKITVNKDFGAGYFYEVIMEDARLQTSN